MRQTCIFFICLLIIAGTGFSAFAEDLVFDVNNGDIFGFKVGEELDIVDVVKKLGHGADSVNQRRYNFVKDGFEIVIGDDGILLEAAVFVNREDIHGKSLPNFKGIIVPRIKKGDKRKNIQKKMKDKGNNLPCAIGACTMPEALIIEKKWGHIRFNFLMDREVFSIRILGLKNLSSLATAELMSRERE